MLHVFTPLNGSGMWHRCLPCRLSSWTACAHAPTWTHLWPHVIVERKIFNWYSTGIIWDEVMPLFLVLRQDSVENILAVLVGFTTNNTNMKESILTR